MCVSEHFESIETHLFFSIFFQGSETLAKQAKCESKLPEKAKPELTKKANPEKTKRPRMQSFREQGDCEHERRDQDYECETRVSDLKYNSIILIVIQCLHWGRSSLDSHSLR